MDLFYPSHSFISPPHFVVKKATSAEPEAEDVTQEFGLGGGGVAVLNTVVVFFFFNQG